MCCLVADIFIYIQGGSNMTGTDYTCLHTNQSRSYLDHLVFCNVELARGLGIVLLERKFVIILF